MAHLRTTGGGKNLSGPRLRALREEQHLSQEKLAGKLQLLGMDIDRNVIKRIENGDRTVSDMELQLFAKFFQVSYKYLIDGEE